MDNPQLNSILQTCRDRDVESIVKSVYEVLCLEQRFRKLRIPVAKPLSRLSYYVSGDLSNDTVSYGYTAPLEVRYQVYSIVVSYLYEFGKHPTEDVICEKLKLLTKENPAVILTWMGYETYFSPKYPEGVLLENTGISYKKIRYLNLLLDTLPTREVYFIGETCIGFNPVQLMHKELWKSNRYDKHKVISVTYSVLSKTGFVTGVVCREDNKDYFKRWVLDLVLPLLSKNSVLIFDENDATLPEIETVSKYDSKSKMIDVLKNANIPFSETMHRAEMWLLIQNLVKPKPSALLNIMKSRGFEVILKPDILYDLTPNTTLWTDSTLLFNKDNFGSQILGYLNNLPLDVVSEAFNKTVKMAQLLKDNDEKYEFYLEKYKCL